MPLQLDAYYVDRLTFEVVDDWDEDEPESSWDIEVDPTHLRNDENPFEQQVALWVRFGPAEGASAPYRGEIAGRAFFHVTDEDDLERAANLVAFNGASILFGLLRGQLAQVTAFARWSTFLMPPVNLVEAFAKAFEREDEPADEKPRAKRAAPKKPAAAKKTKKPEA
jgi:preprotein translocase subunit SecB